EVGAGGDEAPGGEGAEDGGQLRRRQRDPRRPGSGEDEHVLDPLPGTGRPQQAAGERELPAALGLDGGGRFDHHRSVGRFNDVRCASRQLGLAHGSIGSWWLASTSSSTSWAPAIPLDSSRCTAQAMAMADATDPARNPCSTRGRRSWERAVTMTNTTSPTAQPTTTRGESLRTMRAWASDRASMETALAAAR